MSDAERARLAWRCRRGLLELDLLLQGFLDTGYAALNAEERREFAALLELSDPQLLALLLGQERASTQGGCHVVEKIRRAAQTGA